MSGEQGWRTETNSGDYFGHQQKQAQLADRRPVIRKPSSLVGPGIAATAVRITNFNDELALYNGYFSAAPGALNAPNNTHTFVGYVVIDAELGGEQVFRSLDNGTQYVRVVRRNPSDPTSLSWGNWITGA